MSLVEETVETHYQIEVTHGYRIIDTNN